MATWNEINKLFKFNTDNSSWFYTGDLSKGKKVIADDGFSFKEDQVENYWIVYFSFDNNANSNNYSIRGIGKTLDDAWRYAIGAELLPYNSKEATVPEDLNLEGLR